MSCRPSQERLPSDHRDPSLEPQFRTASPTRRTCTPFTIGETDKTAPALNRVFFHCSFIRQPSIFHQGSTVLVVPRPECQTLCMHNHHSQLENSILDPNTAGVQATVPGLGSGSVYRSRLKVAQILGDAKKDTVRHTARLHSLFSSLAPQGRKMYVWLSDWFKTRANAKVFEFDVYPQRV